MPQKMKISGRITNYELGALAVVLTIPECECETPLSHRSQISPYSMFTHCGTADPDNISQSGN